MAIKLEHISIIVPVSRIRERFGDDVFEERFSLTPTSWHDGHLFREGCMNELDLKDMLDSWEAEGFELFKMVEGKKHWKDVCVCYSGHGPSYPCEWIEYDDNANIVWLKGTAPGPVIGNMQE